MERKRARGFVGHLFCKIAQHFEDYREATPTDKRRYWGDLRQERWCMIGSSTFLVIWLRKKSLIVQARIRKHGDGMDQSYYRSCPLCDLGRV